MILTPSEYAQSFKLGKKWVSARTVIRRCMKNMLPSDHKARKLPRGVWVIEIPDNKKPA